MSTFPASTRKLYEKKLQKLLDGGPGPLPSTDVLANHNGNGESDIYSDKEDGEDELKNKVAPLNPSEEGGFIISNYVKQLIFSGKL